MKITESIDEMSEISDDESIDATLVAIDLKVAEKTTLNEVEDGQESLETAEEDSSSASPYSESDVFQNYKLRELEASDIKICEGSEQSSGNGMSFSDALSILTVEWSDLENKNLS